MTDSHSPTISEDHQKLEILKIAISELKRSYDVINRSIDKLQTKTLAYMAATFTLLTYLFNGGDLFIPDQVYGRIFYFIGLAFTILAALLFMYCMRPVTYLLTTELTRLKSIPEKTEKEYLTYVKDEYVNCLGHNSKLYESKHSDFNRGFILLVIGAFILVIIKTFPDNVHQCYTTNSTDVRVQKCIKTTKGSNK